MAGRSGVRRDQWQAGIDPAREREREEANRTSSERDGGGDDDDDGGKNRRGPRRHGRT